MKSKLKTKHSCIFNFCFDFPSLIQGLHAEPEYNGIGFASMQNFLIASLVPGMSVGYPAVTINATQWALLPSSFQPLGNCTLPPINEIAETK